MLTKRKNRRSRSIDIRGHGGFGKFDTICFPRNLLCFGLAGQLGDKSMTNRARADAVVGLRNVTDVSTSKLASCFIAAPSGTSQLLCAGTSYFGEAGRCVARCVSWLRNPQYTGRSGSHWTITPVTDAASMNITGLLFGKVSFYRSIVCTDAVTLAGGYHQDHMVWFAGSQKGYCNRRKCSVTLRRVAH